MPISINRRLLQFGAAILFGSVAVAVALEVPFLAGRVMDQANLLGEAYESELEMRLQQLEEETGAQVAVLTVASLEGDPIEDFSVRVVETWKLGREGVDDGVLILIARDDRRMRIEVGYGLEGALTDAQAGRIIDGLMSPRFREGDFEGGVDASVGAISAAVRGEDLPLPEPSESGEANPISVFVFLIFGLQFIYGALTARGAPGWVLGFFLTPFFFAVPAVIISSKVGLIVAGAWLIVFPILRFILPKGPARRGSGSRGSSFWGTSSGGGGGFSGGGFSGGGGSFGGGGASGGW